MREKKSPKRPENLLPAKTQGCVICVYIFQRFLWYGKIINQSFREKKLRMNHDINLNIHKFMEEQKTVD